MCCVTVVLLLFLGFSGITQNAQADSGGWDPPYEDTIPTVNSNSASDSLLLASPEVAGSNPFIVDLITFSLQLL